jgi:hypothetical protein
MQPPEVSGLWIVEGHRNHPAVPMIRARQDSEDRRQILDEPRSISGSRPRQSAL